MERRDFLAMLASTPGLSIPSAESAQAVTPAAGPKPLSITLLGTGTPSPSLDRQSSGYLIEAGHDVIVWDHGNHRDNAVIAKRAGVKTLVLTHLLGQIDRPSVRELVIHEIQQVFGGKVIWGEDLMRLTPADARVSTIESRQG